MRHPRAFPNRAVRILWLLPSRIVPSSVSYIRFPILAGIPCDIISNLAPYLARSPSSPEINNGTERSRTLHYRFISRDDQVPCSQKFRLALRHRQVRYSLVPSCSKEAPPLSYLPELLRNPNGGWSIAQNQMHNISKSCASGRPSLQY